MNAFVMPTRCASALFLLRLLALPGAAQDAAPVRSAIAFEDVSASCGLSYEGKSWSLAFGDVNGDGRPELWSTNHGHSQLYWNRGDGTFRLEEEQRFRPGDHHGSAWGDFDRDGDDDLLELTGAQRGHGKGANQLHVNTAGKLQDQAPALGLDVPTLRGRAPFWLDFDRDGELDVLLACARREDTASELYLQRNGVFVRDPSVKLGQEQAMFAQLASLGPAQENWLLLHSFRYPQLVLDLSASPPCDITATCGLPSLDSVEDAALADFDGDGTMDLFLARGSEGSELVRESAQHAYAHIVILDAPRGLAVTSTGTLSIGVHPAQPDWWSAADVFLGEEGRHPSALPCELRASDVRGSWNPARTVGLEKGVFVLADPDTGRWTIFVHGPPYEMATLELRQLDGSLGALEPLGFEAEPRRPRDALLLRRGPAFVDHAAAAGIVASNSFGVAPGDFDNDGDVDLFVVTGTSLTNPPDVLYENLGGARFRSLAGAAGAAGEPRGVGDVASVADVDGDGFLDLVVANGRGLGPLTEGPLQLFRNRGNANHWLRLRLRGRANLEPIGARVVLALDGVRQTRTLGSQAHRGAQDERTLHFGLGRSTRATRLEVHWPGGATTILTDVAADQVLELQQE